jgi:S1-C subfamily serine protease
LSQGLPTLNIGDAVVNDQSNIPPLAPKKSLKPRRLALLASVAGLSMAALVVGSGGYRPLNLPPWTTSAQAAEAAQAPAGFADLVSKVKPAVISVRVKIDDDGAETAVSQQDSEGTDRDQFGSPFDRFFSDNSASAARMACLTTIGLSRAKVRASSSRRTAML